MVLELHPLQEEDLGRFANIQIAAFEGPMSTFLFPGQITDKDIENLTNRAVESFRTEPDCHWLKIVDTSLDNKIIAVSKWRINEKEKTEEEIQSMIPVPSEESKKQPARVDFMNHLALMRKKYIGTKPFYRELATAADVLILGSNAETVLHLLVTDPEHHRRGAGAQLVKWGIEKADKAGLPSYLEASEVGEPLYSRLGFKEVDKKVFDLAKYGGSGTLSNIIMIRPPPQKV